MTSRVNSKSGQHALIYLLTYSQYDFSFFLSAEFDEDVDPRLAASKEIFPHGPNLFAFRVSQVQVKSEVIHTQHCALRGVRRRWSAPLCPQSVGRSRGYTGARDRWTYFVDDSIGFTAF